MDIWLVAFIGGIVGATFMDFVELQLSRVGISSGVKGANYKVVKDKKGA